MYVATYACALGGITLAGEGEKLMGLWFDGQKYFGAGLLAGSVPGEAPVFAAARRWLDQYFAGENPGWLPPLEPVGTPFQREVWAQLLAVPYGSTTTYRALAAKLGRPRACQAVGGAVGRNPISIFIPCHRVLGSDGSLTGYAGGLDRKRSLLRLEGASILM